VPVGDAGLQSKLRNGILRHERCCWEAYDGGRCGAVVAGRGFAYYPTLTGVPQSEIPCILLSGAAPPTTPRSPRPPLHLLHRTYKQTTSTPSAKQTVSTAIMGGETVKEEKLKSSYPTRAPKPVGQLIHAIYKERLEMFYSGGQYESKNLRAYVAHGLSMCH
jgi:hypothetical protein